MAGVIRTGDTSNHGGVVSGTPGAVTAGGIPVVRAGDPFVCGIALHNPPSAPPNVVVSASAKVKSGGRGIAFNNNTTTCGATLISSHPAVDVS